MKFILYSDIEDKSIKDSLGRPDYSYYFLRKAFEPLLAKIGEVVVVQGSLDEVDRLYERCLSEGESCAFFWFGPPNKTPLHLKCPIVPVFAWEFTNIPYEVWDDDRRNDWRHVFAATGRAISQSSYGVNVVREVMGKDFPVISLPAPTWDRFAELRRRLVPQPVAPQTEVRVRGDVMDSRLMELSPENELPADMRTEAIIEQRRAEAAPPEPVVLLPFVAGIEPQPDPVVEDSRPDPVVGDVGEIQPKTMRYRARATARHLVGWYREVIRDLLPFSIVWAASHLVRGIFTAMRPVRPRDKVQRRSFLMRIEATKRHLLDWYRDVLGDIMPSWIARPSARALRLVYGVTLGPLLYRALPPPPPPPPSPTPEPQPEVSFTVDGVVYTSVLNPTDGRKNFDDIVTAFCWAFRDKPDATLILKIVHNDRNAYWRRLERLLNLLSPFRCRVIAFHGYMEDPEFESLIATTSYCVNASHGEGLCLPLIEYMSCGKPAIAPGHTAMEDYIDENTAFVIRSSKEHNVWPQDTRDLYRTMRYRINWESLRDAYLESYHVAKELPERYAAMSRAAIEKQRRHSEFGLIEERLKAFLTATNGQNLIPAIRGDEQDVHAPCPPPCVVGLSGQ